MVTNEIHVESFCRLATGTGFKVDYEGRPYAVFLHRFGKQDVTPLDGLHPPLSNADTQEILDAVTAHLRGFDWQGGRE